MLCPNCRSVNRDEAKYCDECGFPLTGAIARAAQEASSDADAIPDSERANGEVVGELDEEPVDLEPVRPEGDSEETDNAEAPSDEGPAEGEAPVSEGAQGEDSDESADDVELSGEDAAQEDYAEESLYDYEPAADDITQVIGLEAADADADFTQVIGLAENLAGDDITQVIADAPIGVEGVQPTQRLDGVWVPDATMQMPRVESDQDVQSRDFMASSAKEQRKSRKGLVIGIVAVLLVAAAVAATYVMGLWGGKVVPDVTGMTEADARAALESDGFTVKTLQVKSDDTEGLVLLMDPSSGSRAPEESEVAIHVATARLIPDVVGKTQDEAQELLVDAGYENIEVVMQKSNGDEGVVLSVSPESGTRAKSTSAVTIAVSEPFLVPDVSGMGVYEAYDAVEAAGLTPSIVYVDTDAYIDGTFLGAYPEPGTKMNEGDYVSLSVARSRGLQLEALTQSLLAPGSTITYGGYEYDIESLGYVSYLGNNTVSFSATGRPKITFFGETLFTSASQQITGSVVWSDDNQVISIM